MSLDLDELSVNKEIMIFMIFRKPLTLYQILYGYNALELPYDALK